MGSEIEREGKRKSRAGGKLLKPKISADFGLWEVGREGDVYSDEWGIVKWDINGE